MAIGEVIVAKWGYNADVDAFSGEEDVISEGGDQYWASVASVLQISSTSANDTGNGTGARTLTIVGIDANGYEISENITLNGTSTVTTKQAFIRVNRAYVLTSGSSGNNEGDISITDGTGIMCFIAIGVGQTEKATYTLPYDIDDAVITKLQLSIHEKQTQWITGFLQTRALNTNTWRIRDRMIASDDEKYSEEDEYIEVKGGDDIRIRVIDASADNIPVKGSFTINKIV